MPYLLKEGVFQVKCRWRGCPFKSEFKIHQTIMGATERDVEHEAIKIAHDMAVLKHDAIYGRVHTLTDPVIRKVGGSYSHFGAARPAEAHGAPAASVPATPPGARMVKSYQEGEAILAKGDTATTVCEVVEGTAHPEHSPEFSYKVGDAFGAAGLLAQQSRTASVVAGPEGATVAFYNVQELRRSNPAKAQHLVNEVMEDLFNVISFLDEQVVTLRAKVSQAQSAASRGAAAKARPKGGAAPGKVAKAKKPKAKAKKPAAKVATAKRAKAKKPKANKPRAKKAK